MQLILTNGYPFPYPEGLTEYQTDAIALDAQERRLVLEGVKAFETKYTVTVEFVDAAAYHKAREATGWADWDGEGLILEAPASAKDGYDFPAIVAGGFAWCGIFLASD